jgi:hypothetical protein
MQSTSPGGLTIGAIVTEEERFQAALPNRSRDNEEANEIIEGLSPQPFDSMVLGVDQG